VTVLAPPDNGRSVVGIRTTTDIEFRLPLWRTTKYQICNDARAHRDER